MAKKDLNFLFSAPIAHRGLYGFGKPENSMAAFGAAVCSGYVIELDVHLLADGAVAVFHDDNLKRMCGVDVDIRELTARKIKKYRLDDTKERIPLLKDVLTLVGGAVPIIIELKYDVSAGRLEKALAPILKDYPGQYALKSFNPIIVRNLRKLFRAAPVGQLYSSAMFDDLCSLRRWFFERAVVWSLWRSDFASVNQKDLTDPVIASLRASSKPILAWTIRSAGERLSVLRLADNCICERFL